MNRVFQQAVLESYLKNKDDFRALLLREYPTFVYRRVGHIMDGEIPVFTFHSVEARQLESQLRYLSDNNYVTLNADELYEALTRRRKVPPNAVVLTFDDGRGSLWSIAYPLLKKYGFCAISFIVPFWIRESPERYPNLVDVWEGRARLEELEQREGHAPLCFWQEIREMSRSGVIDFQSHSSYHHSIYVSNKIADFINPSFRPSFLCSYLNPVVRRNGEDVFLEELEWGHPIYEWAPALSGRTRYIEDERLTGDCIASVKQAGGASFFRRSDWRKKLRTVIKDLTSRDETMGRSETQTEKHLRIQNDLAASKQLIEDKLNTQVRHLCYPWYVGSQLAVELSQKVGYVANYWGILRDRASARIDCDPFYIGRVNDDYIITLPGRGRTSLFHLLLKKFLVNVQRNWRKHAQLSIRHRVSL